MRTLNSSALNIDAFDSHSPHPPTPVLASGHHHHHNPPPRRSKTPTIATAKHRPPPQVTASRAGAPSNHHHHHQHHVLAVTTTTTATTNKRSVSSSSSNASSTSRMPPGDSSRPRPPQLSAAAAKTVGRTPLTPKIAQAPKASPAPLMAPLARRTTGNSIASLSAGRDDASSPGPGSATPLNGFNQRSGSRSTHSTPNGTPNPERSSEGWDHRASYGFDAGRQSLQGNSSSNNSDAKFFYASDAQTTLQQPPPTSRPSSTTCQKPATFFYANGTTAEAKRTTSPPVTSPYSPMLASTPEPSSTKFFYANGTPDLSLKPPVQASGPPSASSSSSRLVNGRPSTSSSTGLGFSMPQRPVSPVKMLQQQMQQPTLKSSAIPPLPNNRPQIASPPQLSPAAAGPTSKRRVSIESAPRSVRGHARTGSVPTMDSWTASKIPVSPKQPRSESVSPPASPGTSQPAMTMASILQAVEDLGEEDDDDSRDDTSHGDLQSPTKSTHGNDPVSELVANARRERKVQDLEITNASLEAINRTLERQLRKQTAELRRYKRLSRSGHLSMASSRVPSQSLPNVPMSLPEFSEDDDMEDDLEDEDGLDSLEDSELSGTESASTSNPTSPMNEKALIRRKRDEKRLQLDLSKHRELLVDSQKINQSLKRCLNWTEVLIKEGQKALEYKVRVSDVQFGGHVLAPPDEEDGTSQDGEDPLRSYETGLVSGLEPQWGKGSQDRDSGIELPADGG